MAKWRTPAWRDKRQRGSWKASRRSGAWVLGGVRHLDAIMKFLEAHPVERVDSVIFRGELYEGERMAELAPLLRLPRKIERMECGIPVLDVH
jgi:hypothetical protein